MSSAQALNLQTVAEDREDHDGDMTQHCGRSLRKGFPSSKRRSATSYLSPL
jgi:hypothetical protein